jgi:hypothetical protein
MSCQAGSQALGTAPSIPLARGAAARTRPSVYPKPPRPRLGPTHWRIFARSCGRESPPRLPPATHHHRTKKARRRLPALQRPAAPATSTAARSSAAQRLRHSSVPVARRSCAGPAMLVVSLAQHTRLCTDPALQKRGVPPWAALRHHRHGRACDHWRHLTEAHTHASAHAPHLRRHRTRMIVAATRTHTLTSRCQRQARGASSCTPACAAARQRRAAARRQLQAGPAR